MTGQVVDMPGWWHTRWGMSESEMIEALSASKLHKIDREDFGDYYADYLLKDAEHESLKFDVFFQMSRKQDRLSRVVMRHELPLGAPQDTQIKTLFNALVRDFGGPEMLDRPNHYRWTLPSTTVQLHTINLPNSLNLISLIFEPG
ncbi:hypothetical protein ACFHWW_04875 [Ensifer sp. P24N7]|uniref:hypothetical protein n=1 Tax=Sinorhizobium sp. P24N7 TaxID=3348358 RepID=UPI0035F3CFCF